MKNIEELNSSFLALVSEFGENLGGCYLQLSDSFGPEEMSGLKEYLKDFPKHIKLFVEVRGVKWFSNAIVRDDYFQTLSDLNVGTVITDAADRRDRLHRELTTPDVFVRFQGYGDQTDFYRIDQWVERIAKWLDNGLQNINFFIDHNERIYTPFLVNYAMSQLNLKTDAKIKELPILSNPYSIEVESKRNIPVKMKIIR